MKQHFKKLESQAEQMLEETKLADRTAELRNILSIIRMQIALLDEGECDNYTALSYEEARDRLRELEKDPSNAGNHNQFREELNDCQDWDDEEDVV